MEIYKDALMTYIYELNDEEARKMFWKLFEKLLDDDKGECSELVSCLARRVENED